MNKDLIILLQNSMAHATQIHLHNKKNEKIVAEEVVATAFEIAGALWEAAQSQEEQPTSTQRQPGQRR
jgi:hypothetical protein